MKSINFHHIFQIQFMFSIFFQRLKIPSAAYFQLHDFNFDDIYMDDDDTLRVIAFCFSLYAHNHVNTVKCSENRLCTAVPFQFICLFVFLCCSQFMTGMPANVFGIGLC